MEIDSGVLARRRIILPRGHPWKQAHGGTMRGASQRTCIRCGHEPGSPSAVQVPGGLPPTGSLASAGAHRPAHYPEGTSFWGMRAAPGSHPALRANHPALCWLADLRGSCSCKGVVKGQPREGREASPSNGRVLSRAGSGQVRSAHWSRMPWACPGSGCSGVNQVTPKQDCRPVRVDPARPTRALRMLAWPWTIFARAPRHRRFLCSGCPPPDPGPRPAEVPPRHAPGSSAAFTPTKV
jgi:hypothetical protein